VRDRQAAKHLVGMQHGVPIGLTAHEHSDQDLRLRVHGHTIAARERFSQALEGASRQPCDEPSGWPRAARPPVPFATSHGAERVLVRRRSAKRVIYITKHLAAAVLLVVQAENAIICSGGSPGESTTLVHAESALE